MIRHRFLLALVVLAAHTPVFSETLETAGAAPEVVEAAPAPATGDETETTPPPLPSIQEAEAVALEPPCNLSLIEAQRVALEQNPSLQAVAEKVEQARQLVRQAQSMYYPRISASFSAIFQWLSEEDRDDANEAIQYLRDTIDDLSEATEGFGGTVLGRDARELRRSLREGDEWLEDLQDELDEVIERYTYGISLQYLLFDGFTRKYTNAVARFGQEETELAQQEGQRLLLDLVAQAFYAVQLARENLHVVESDRAFNLRLLEDAQAMYDYGKAPLSAVLNFDVAVKAADVRALAARGDLDAARLALARLMGLDEARLPEDAHLCPLPEVAPAQLAPVDVDAQLAYALGHRPDLHQKETSVDRAEAEIKRRRGVYYPQVGVGAGAQDSFNFERGPSLDSLSPQVGIAVSYDLYAGGRRKATVLEAEHAKREAEWRARDALLAVQHDVRDSALKLEVAQKRYELLVETVEVVRKTRNLVEEEYRAGKEALTRLNQAQRDLVQAEGQLAFAHVALQQAWFALDTATARSLEAQSGAPAPYGEAQP